MFPSVAAVLVVTVFAIAVQADEHDKGDEHLAMTYRVEVLPGHALGFEKAYKEHLEMHAEAGDPMAREVWEQVAGEGVGTYFIRAAGLTWADMDAGIQIPNDREHIMTAVSPHIENLTGHISEYMMTLSNWPVDYGQPKMLDVTVFNLDYAHIDDFFYGMQKIHQMIVEHDIPYAYAWSKVVVGADGVQLSLSMPRMSWSEFKEPSPSLWEVAAQVMGKREADDLRATIGAAIASEKNFVVVYREDLSYVPEK
jgi:hypothetical protein